MLAASKNHAKILSYSEDCVQGASETNIHPPSKNEELKDIGNSINIVLGTNKSILGSQQWLPLRKTP